MASPQQNPVCEGLRGELRKLGAKGPRRTWKRRLFLQKPEAPNRIYYYTSERSQTEKGFVNMEEAIAVLKTTDASYKRPYCFQINTPRRIYHLQAENETDMNYWLDNLSKVIKRISNAMDETESQLALQLEHSNNRISDLEVENAKLRRALHLAATKLDSTPDIIIRQVERGVSSLQDSHLEDNTDTTTATVDSIHHREDVLDLLLPSQRILPNPNSNDVQVKLEGNDSSSESESEYVDTSGHFNAVVLYDYNARKNYELSITVNEVITVMSKHENGWWLGCNREGQQGYFPGSYVRPVTEETTSPDNENNNNN